jgi:type IV pilus assembly protein PilC
MGNVIYESILKEAYSEVERGVPLSVPLSKSSFFPTMVGQMVGVGEKTGKLDQIMNNLSSYYEEESERKIKGLSTLIEPMLIVIIGIAVAIMVFAVIMPIYGLAQIT